MCRAVKLTRRPHVLVVKWLLVCWALAKAWIFCIFLPPWMRYLCIQFNFCIGTTIIQYNIVNTIYYIITELNPNIDGQLYPTISLRGFSDQSGRITSSGARILESFQPQENELSSSVTPEEGTAQFWNVLWCEPLLGHLVLMSHLHGYRTLLRIIQCLAPLDVILPLWSEI